MTITRLPIALAIAALPFALHAQESRLSSVVVTAPKIDDQTLNASQKDAASLVPMRAATSDTASTLGDVPGVSLYGAGGVSSLPAIHGMADDRVRVKVDGMDLLAACPNHMNPALSYIDPTNVGALTVYAGITPVSVGGDSIGGTIIAETPEPEFAVPGQGNLFKGQLGAFYRSNGNATGGNVSATFATELINLTYSGAIAESDNYKAASDFKTFTATGRPGHTLPLDEVGSTAYKTQNHTLGLALKNANHLFEAKFGYQHIPYELYPNQRMDMLGNTQNRFNLRYLGRFDWGNFEARAYHETVKHHMDFGDDKQFVYGPNPPSTIVAPGMPMDTEGKTTGASVKADLQLSKQDLLRIGGEYQSYRLNDWWPPSPSSLAGMFSSPGVPATTGGMAPNTFWNINDGKRDRLGVFAEWEANWNREWLSLLGVRVEQVNMDTGPVQGYNNTAMYNGTPWFPVTTFNAHNRHRTDDNLDLTALGRYTPDAEHSFEFGYARKTRSPNLYERYSWSMNAMALEMNNFVGDGNGYFGNPDLKPEVAHTLSATADWHDAERTHELKITPYYTRATDFIDAVQWNRTTNQPATILTANVFTALRYVNQPARLYGLDISGRTPLAKTGWGAWGLKGLLNYTNGKNRSTGDELYNIMPLNAKLALTHQLGGWDNSVEVVMVDAKDKVSDQRNEIKTPGYSLVNLRASYSWRQTRVDFGVENLFDKFYRLPLGGAYTGQGTTMSMTGVPWGIAIPGMGRSLYAGVNVKF
jgi:iron complex outermembrane receptor protein